MSEFAALAVVLGLVVAGCESSPEDGGNDGNRGGTNASGAGGSKAGSVATGGVAPQGGVAGTTPTGGGVSGTTGGAAAQGGVAGAGALGGVTGGTAGNGASAGNGGGGTAGTGGRPSHNGTLKIMPLGDSITQSSCYRARLWQKLQQAGKTNFDFVGTQTSSGCGISGYDAQHEGHGGYLVTNLTGAMMSELRGFIMTNPPDLVLFHFGTNDAWNDIAPATILSAFGIVVDELRARNQNAEDRPRLASPGFVSLALQIRS